MGKTRRYTFAISRETFERRGISGFLDMLRYDDANVIDYSHRFVIVQTRNRPPTRERWASFGMYPLAEQEGDYPDIRLMLEEAARRVPEPAR